MNNSRIGALVSASLLALPLGCSNAEDAAEVKDPIQVTTVRVSRQSSYATVRRFSGVARSKRESRLGFERGGKITRILVDDGSTVKRGQLVAELDRSQLLAARKRLVASLREAEASVGLAELTATRLKSLADEEFTSRQDSDEATFGLSRQLARRDSLEASIREIDVDLGKSRLYAPFGGQVSARLVDEGTVVGAGTPVIRFLEDGLKEAAVGVPISLSDEFMAGQPIVVELNGREIEATVSTLIRDVDVRTRTASLIVTLPVDADVADGEVVTVSHDRTVETPGFWIPLTSMTKGVRGLWTVYALDGEGSTASLRSEAVQVLHAETDRAFVQGTLEDGDRVVSTGLHRVVPGQAVRSKESVAEVSR